jgi:hypothetical protein
MTLQQTTENTYQDNNQISSMGQATKVTGRLTSLHNACGDGQPVGRPWPKSSSDILTKSPPIFWAIWTTSNLYSQVIENNEEFLLRDFESKFKGLRV